jgi:hypothetical protein
MEEIAEESESPENLVQPTKLECQSDIVIGQQHYSVRKDYEEFLMEGEDDERRTNSDIHELFFVNELLKDDEKFDRLLNRKPLHSSSDENAN